MRCLLLALGLAGCAVHRLPPPTDRPGKQLRVDVAMRDGIGLRTRVRLPKGDGPFPSILIRAPYPMGLVLSRRCAIFNRYGYACAWQMERGRGRSGGEWEPFVHETDDGHDALDWMARQPWCNGHIAMLGESYLGASAWAEADDPPAALDTILPTVIGTDLYDATYEGGMFRHDIVTAWMALMPGHEFRYLSGSHHYHRALKRRPRIEMDLAAAHRVIPWFRDWLGAESPDAPFWQRDYVKRSAAIPAHTEIPVLMTAGWSDAFLGPELVTWDQLASRDRSTLVIGPWDHLSHVAASVKQAGLDDAIGLWPTYVQWPRVLDWLGHQLEGKPLKYPVGGVASYVVNGGGWTWYASWPPPTTPATWHLAPGDDPQRCTGALQDTAGSGEVDYTYDPAHPTPARGGAGVLAGAFPLWRGARPGFLDQHHLCEHRDDLVGFVSAPLPADLHVAGALTATLTVASDAPDTAFDVRFLEERPDGRRIMVREDILALSARDGVDTTPYVPGTEVRLSLKTWPVEYVFQAGSRLLVEVASASFPKYEAHSNTAGPWAQATSTAIAHQRVVLDGSEVVLPVVDR